MKKQQTLIYKYLDNDIISVRHSSFCTSPFREHMHPTFSIGLILGGVADVNIDGENFVASRNTTVLINPGQKHCCNPHSDCRWSYYMFYIDEKWLSGQIRKITGTDMQKPVFDGKIIRNDRLASLLKSLYMLISGSADITAVEKNINDCMRMIFNSECSLGSVSSRKIVSDAVSAMNENLEENLSLDDISSVAGLSQYHFLRIFKKETGITPHKYLLNLKVIKSQKLLENGHTPLDIGYRLGFTDQSHFIRTFRECTGITPGQYVRSLRRSDVCSEQL